MPTYRSGLESIHASQLLPASLQVLPARMYLVDALKFSIGIHWDNKFIILVTTGLPRNKRQKAGDGFLFYD
jgi:hypothetical protein